VRKVLCAAAHQESGSGGQRGGRSGDQQRAKTRLAAAGFELATFRMNQLVVALPEQEESEPDMFEP